MPVVKIICFIIKCRGFLIKKSSYVKKGYCTFLLLSFFKYLSIFIALPLSSETGNAAFIVHGLCLLV